MKYDKAGEYELIYTASDSCGNETTATRQVTVSAPTPSQTLLLRGGAEDNYMSPESVSSAELTPLTHVFDGEYTGAFEIRIFNLQYRQDGDVEWTVKPEFIDGATELTYSPTDWSSDSIGSIYINNTTYFLSKQPQGGFYIQDNDNGMQIKWDSLEIWTETEG